VGASRRPSPATQQRIRLLAPRRRRLPIASIASSSLPLRPIGRDASIPTDLEETLIPVGLKQPPPHSGTTTTTAPSMLQRSAMVTEFHLVRTLVPICPPCGRFGSEDLQPRTWTSAGRPSMACFPFLGDMASLPRLLFSAQLPCRPQSQSAFSWLYHHRTPQPRTLGFPPPPSAFLSCLNLPPRSWLRLR